MGEIVWHEFETSQWLTHGLATKIKEATISAIDQHGTASWVLSGGSSPKKLYQALAKDKIPWPQLTCLLTDERCLPDGHTKTNAAMVWRQLLSQHPEVNWVPIWDSAQVSLEAALAAGTSRLTGIEKPFTCTLLGMGPDGHTASLFPGCNASIEGLTSDCEQALVYTESPQYPKKRISLSLPLLLNSEHIILLIMGERKKEVLMEGLEGTKVKQEATLPIHQLIKMSQKPVQVYWSPSEKILKR